MAFTQIETLFDTAPGMGLPKRPPLAPRGLSLVPERIPRWARRYSARSIVAALIRGRWRFAVLRGWAAPDSATWYAAFEFKYVRVTRQGLRARSRTGRLAPSRMTPTWCAVGAASLRAG